MISYSALKKSVICLTVISLMFTLSGCKKNSSNVDDKPAEIVLVTDFGTVDDNSYNQMAWEGIKEYAEQNGIAYDYYKPEGTDTDSIMAQIKRGIGNGAKLFVCPGTMLEVPVYIAADKYDDASFILIDGIPHNEDNTDQKIADNVSVVSFAEEEAGFLAGYAAVRDGYRGLGFMGGVPIDPVIRFGYGFVQGADYAAIEMGVNVHVRYTYTDTFEDTPSVEEMASAWFDDDTEVIFACGGSIDKPIIRAAEGHVGRVIGVDVDESAYSETVLTSAMKDVKTAVYNDIKAYYDGTFAGGAQTNMTAASGGVALPMDTSRFEKFDKESYDSIISQMTDGMIVPYNKTDIGTCEELTLINTEVTFIDY